MKATGIVRKIDELGRVVIPMEMRRTLNMRKDDPLEISTEHGGILLRKCNSVGGIEDVVCQLKERIQNTDRLDNRAEMLNHVGYLETLVAKQGGNEKPCNSCDLKECDFKHNGNDFVCSRGYVLTAADKQRSLHESYEEGVRNGEFKE